MYATYQKWFYLVGDPLLMEGIGGGGGLLHHYNCRIGWVILPYFVTQNCLPKRCSASIRSVYSLTRACRRVRVRAYMRACVPAYIWECLRRRCGVCACVCIRTNVYICVYICVFLCVTIRACVGIVVVY